MGINKYTQDDTPQGIGKRDMESPAKAVENMPLPLVQKLIQKRGKISKQIRTQVVDGLGGTYGFEMARKESNENWLMRVPYYMFYYDKPVQNELGVMAFLEAHE